MQEILSKTRYLERSKLETLIFIFKIKVYFSFPNQSPFNGESYQKQKGPGTSDQSLFKLQYKFGKIPL